MSRTANAFERLGAFYLGRRFDPAAGDPTDEVVLYDPNDLTTHAVIVGMTGSGKTGLGVALLEEAAIDGIPAIVIDPKGDLANLALTFPKLAAADFRPWIDDVEAAREGHDPDDHARATAKRWRDGIAAWGQDGKRIARLREAAEVAVFTPGSSSGRPLAVFDSFAAPSAAVRDDPDAMRERIHGAVAGLTALLGIEGDPTTSREHVLLASLLEHGWSEGRDLDLAALVRAVREPPFERLGVLDLESFFPADDRFALAMRLNALLASPTFGVWAEGEPLDVSRLLVADDGRPRIAVLSIAHLEEQERMFFVTLLLNEVVSWMRAQSGTRSLRAILYMDEVFGFLPPTANPPSKRPLLTLLKQARASGLGVVLATQNPVDLDYKALSNAGTWFLGRLQTERDKARVLDGLEGASPASGAGFDREEIGRILSGLSSRVFWMHDVHEDEPVLFHTRWCLSFLRGPMTRDQIRRLIGSAAAKVARAPASGSRSEPASPAPEAEGPSERPVVDPGVEERFVRPATIAKDARLVWRPAVHARASLHWVSAKHGIDSWREVVTLGPLTGEGSDPWLDGVVRTSPLELAEVPDVEGAYAALPSGATRPAAYTRWKKRLASHLYKERTLELQRATALKLVSEPGERPEEFQARLRQAVRERRDLEMAKLKKRYIPKLARLRERIAKAEQKVEKEREQLKQQKMNTAISVGATLLGALLGRKTVSVGTVGRATTAARGAGRISRESGDVSRAQGSLEELQVRLDELEATFEEELEQVRAELDAETIELTPVRVRPRKGELDVRDVMLVWTPWAVSPDGIATPAYADRSEPLRDDGPDA